MKTTKKWKTCLACAFFLICLPLSLATAQSPQKVITWDFSPASPGAMPGGSYYEYCFEPFADLINADTNGRLKLNVHTGLVKDARVIEAVRDGTMDMGANITQIRAELPLLGFHVLPFIPHEKLTMIERTMKPTFKKVLEEKHNLVLLGVGYHAKQRVFSKKPILTVEDMKGVKIRVSTKETLELLKAVGANPVFMPMSEVYTSLQRGVIDAGVTSIEGAVGKKWYEVVKYSSDWPMGNGTFIYFANKKSWAALPSDLQKLLLMAFDDKYELGTFYGCYDDDAKFEPMLKSKYGMKFVTPDPAEVKKYLAHIPPVFAKWKERVGPSVDEIMPVINLVLGTNY